MKVLRKPTIKPSIPQIREIVLFYCKTVETDPDSRPPGNLSPHLTGFGARAALYNRDPAIRLQTLAENKSGHKQRCGT